MVNTYLYISHTCAHLHIEDSMFLNLAQTLMLSLQYQQNKGPFVELYKSENK